jgi:NADPH:quinone reductase-like Zn-dependent oxidoreductase
LQIRLSEDGSVHSSGTTKENAMKAIVQHGFGSPGDVLTLDEIAEPVVDDDEVLVRVHAASIHIGDSHAMRGVPYVMRPIFRLSGAKSRVPGTDIAGTVEALGKSVTGIGVGDEVFGWGKGAFAEYGSFTEDALALKPANLTFEQAAAVGVSAFTALQGLRDHGKIQAGQKVLITGASGGVGTFAVQIAKSFGAEVTGVCSTRNIDMVRSIGADHVIDYTEEDFTRGTQRYDLILDNVGSHSLSDTRAALTPDGTLLANGAPVSGWVGGLGHFAKASIVSLFVGRQGRPFLSLPNTEDLATLRDLTETGKVTPVIDQTFPLSRTAEAMAHVGEGHAQGTTVITM